MQCITPRWPSALHLGRGVAYFENLDYARRLKSQSRRNPFYQGATKDERGQPAGQWPERRMSPNRSYSQIHEYGSSYGGMFNRRLTKDWESVRRTAKTFNTPPDSEDRSSDQQPPVNLTVFGDSPFSAESWLLFASPIEIGNGGDWQGSQSEEYKGRIETTVEGGDEEPNNSTGNR